MRRQSDCVQYTPTRLTAPHRLTCFHGPCDGEDHLVTPVGVGFIEIIQWSPIRDCYEKHDYGIAWRWNDRTGIHALCLVWVP